MLPTTDPRDQARTSTPQNAPAPRRPLSALLLVGQRPYVAELHRLLAMMDVPVETCGTAGEALDIAGRNALRCVVVPADLAEARVASLLADLKRIAPRLPVLVIAESLDVDATVEAMRAGAYAVIDARQLRSGLFRNLPGLSVAE